MSEYNRQHIDITALGQRRAFKSPGSNARQRVLNRVRADHGLRLITEIGNAFAEAEAGQRGLPEQPVDLETAGGVFIEVELNPAAGATNLERRREGTRQAAEIVDENGVRRIALFVPDDMRDAFSQVFEDYTNGELSEKGSSPKKTRVEPIEHIRAARLQSFWRDAPEALPEDPQAQMWWALWCFNDRIDRVLGSAAVLGLHVGNPDTFLRFPETTVIPAYGRRASIEMLLFAT
ncbi:MAG: peptidase S8 family protein, partial [bacterium]